MDIFFVERKTGERKREIVAGGKHLNWMYSTKTGMTILELAIKKKFLTSLYGKLQDLSYSTRKINSFVRDLEIDMKEAEIENPKEYRNFNDFFARKLKKNARLIAEDRAILSSPADGRVLAYDSIDMDRILQVKGSQYSLKELFGDSELAKNYNGGVCIVIRLCPADYHRFHFPDGGTPGETREIKGLYYSVNPIALNKVARIYCQNKRVISILESDNFKDIAILEIGATFVGSIIQTYRPHHRVEKGEEKGYFKFGGSTVILFFEKDVLKVDQDILNNTSNGLETKVNMGEGIGKRIVK